MKIIDFQGFLPLANVRLGTTLQDGDGSGPAPQAEAPARASAFDAAEATPTKPGPIFYGPSGYLFWGGRLYLDAAAPNAAALAAQCPDCPAVNQNTLALLDRLTHENATLEAKVALLKQAVADP